MAWVFHSVHEVLDIRSRPQVVEPRQLESQELDSVIALPLALQNRFHVQPKAQIENELGKPLITITLHR
jgi:hypothetical protein